MEQPRAGKHYPRSVGEFQAWFRTDADCLDYLDWLRWPEGFACPGCGHGERWSLSDRRIMCASCGGRTSVTAGTIFERTRTPLTVWFTAGWLFATGKDGISALSLQRTLEIGSYQTAWAMLHRLRSVLVRPGRDRLAGAVEVDETYIGGEEPGLRGGRARGKKVLTGIAVEVQDPKGLGRCRMGPLPDASASSLHGFVTDHVEPGARVITDGWQGYHGVEQLAPPPWCPRTKKRIRDIPGYTEICRDIVGYSGMGPRRLRPMIVGVPLEPGVGGMGGEYDIDAEGVDGGGPDPIGDGVVADGAGAVDAASPGGGLRREGVRRPAG